MNFRPIEVRVLSSVQYKSIFTTLSRRKKSQRNNSYSIGCVACECCEFVYLFINWNDVREHADDVFRGSGDHEGQGSRLVPEGTAATGDVNVDYTQ